MAFNDEITITPIVFCNCKEEMGLTICETDQDEMYLGFDCPKCDASFYGKWKKPLLSINHGPAETQKKNHDLHVTQQTSMRQP